MKIIPPFSALKSWESYDYQGHIALYIALKELYSIIQNGDDVSRYQLQIEGEEDFALIKDSQYTSLHQVKAGGVNLEDNDKFVFIIEIAEKSNVKGYFHINKTETIDTDFCQKAYETATQVLDDLSKDVINRKDLGDRPEKDFIIREEVRKKHKKGSAYDLINYSIFTNYKNDNSIVNIKDAAVKISNELRMLRDKLKKDIDDLAPDSPDTMYYSVHKDKFDNNKEIREKAAAEIINVILEKKQEYKSFLDEEYAEYVYDRLYSHMKNVFTNHLINKSVNDDCLISFDDIFNVITRNYHEELNTAKYQYSLVLRRIADAFAEYQDSHKGKCPSEECDFCDEKDSCYLRKQITELINNGNDETIQNLIMFTPDARMTYNLPDEELISELLIDLLKEIQNFKLTEKKVFLTENKSKEIYRATLVGDKTKHYFEKKFNKYINDASDKSLLYEADVLITDRLNEQVIRFNGNNFNVLSENETNELLTKGIITSIDETGKATFKPKEIRLVDRNTAIGELK